MRTIYWYFYFGLSLISKTPALLKAKKQKDQLSKEAYEDLINQITSGWAMAQVKNSGARITVSGEENIPEGAVVFVSNHQSNFDIAIFMALIHKNKGYIAKSELLKVPLLRTWMQELRCVFMDRSSVKKSFKAITDGIAILKDGYSLVIFPEGTRSKGGPVKEFKGGSFKLATKPKVPIVPVTIDGSYKLMEANNNRIKPADVQVTIHPPVMTEGLTKEEENELTKKVQDIIEQAIKKL